MVHRGSSNSHSHPRDSSPNGEFISQISRYARTFHPLSAFFSANDKLNLLAEI